LNFFLSVNQYVVFFLKFLDNLDIKREKII